MKSSTFIAPGEPEHHFHFEADPSCSPRRAPGVISLRQYLPELNRAGMRWDGTADWAAQLILGGNRGDERDDNPFVTVTERFRGWSASFQYTHTHTHTHTHTRFHYPECKCALIHNAKQTNAAHLTLCEDYCSIDIVCFCVCIRVNLNVRVSLSTYEWICVYVQLKEWNLF